MEIIKLPCIACKGTGTTENPIDKQIYKCHECGGHAWTPGEGHGYTTFYRPPDPRWGESSARVMVLHRDIEDSSKWRTTMFAPNGPITHHTDSKHWPVMNELRGYHEDAHAGDLLEQWVATNDWIIYPQSKE